MYAPTQKNFILNYHQCHQSINQQNPQNSRFSSLNIPILGLNAYLSPDQDKPGLTRLT